MMKRAIWMFLVVIGATGFLSVQSASAQNSVTLPNPLGNVTTLQDIATSFTNFLIAIAIPLTAIMALVGGFQMITAGGDPEKFASGRKTLMYAAIGFAVVVLAGGIVAIVKNLLGAS
jgi:Type IV secretion system pilin